ncbi:MAG: hypothetical protein ABI156_08460, partial [Caldimonas sp.]
LEVQRMTLSTLKTMNVQMGDLRDSLQIRMPGSTATADHGAAAGDRTADGALPAARKAAKATAAKSTAAKSTAAKTAAAGAVDPLQWWGALTQQFSQLAANAMKESATDAAKKLAGNVITQSLDAASQTPKKAMPGAAAPSTKTAAPRKRTGARARRS